MSYFDDPKVYYFLMYKLACPKCWKVDLQIIPELRNAKVLKQCYKIQQDITNRLRFRTLVTEIPYSYMFFCFVDKNYYIRKYFLYFL